MPSHIGKQTILIEHPVSAAFSASITGKKEGEGPLGFCFDRVIEDTTAGEKSWEKAESRMQKDVVALLLKKSGNSPPDIDGILSGDLLNQCVGSTYGLLEYRIPFLGIYGACSTMAEGLVLASILVDSGAFKKCLAVTSSHFCSAERQFRFPLEYGGIRTPTSQWTATAAGAVLVETSKTGPFIEAVTIGTVEDFGIKDANNMGAAMAPAAASTIERYFLDTEKKPEDFDLILTGDLGAVGSELLLDLLGRKGIDIRSRHNDCGLLLFDRESQDVHAGGSGCGCSASVLSSFILPRMREGILKHILFIATGALHSTTSTQQGESIPSIAHLVEIRSADPSAKKEAL